MFVDLCALYCLHVIPFRDLCLVTISTRTKSSISLSLVCPYYITINFHRVTKFKAGFVILFLIVTLVHSPLICFELRGYRHPHFHRYFLFFHRYYIFLVLVSLEIVSNIGKHILGTCDFSCGERVEVVKIKMGFELG